MHKKFECDECDKVLRFEALLEKHKEAAHEDVELFCQYYNNDKDCPFDDECIYLHKESGNCKYAQSCERKLCIFKKMLLIKKMRMVKKLMIVKMMSLSVRE